MRRAFVGIAMLLAAGCARAGDVDLTAVEVSLVSARAIGCDTVCNSLLVEVVVKNGTSEPVCFSSRYLASALGPVIIFETGRSDTDGFLTNFPRLEDPPDLPDRPAPFVATLKTEPNVYVGPGKELRFEATAFDSYRIPRDRALTATLGMYVYPCEGEGFRRFSPSVPLQTGDAS
jgi:hypothetical protein